MVPSPTSYDLPFPQNGVPYVPNIREYPYLCTGDPIHFMFGSRVGFFRGRRIERRYLRFEQIQDGGCRHVGKISNGHIPFSSIKST